MPYASQVQGRWQVPYERQEGVVTWMKKHTPELSAAVRLP
jgi:hypothetical protein